MEEKDKIIVSLREQLRKVLRENSAQKQEIALLNYELERGQNKALKIAFFELSLKWLARIITIN